MRRPVLLLAAVLTALALAAEVHAQSPVEGTVRSADTGAPLSGVNVMVSHTRVGTLTDAQGRFSLTVPEGGETLVFSRLGYQRVEVAIADGVTEVALVPSAVALEGTVVTALGIERDQRSLGTAQQTVRGDDIAQARETNIVNSLSGRVAGATITNAGPQGGSSRIVIRGATSLAGNNQPLFIVDGVPIDNSAHESTGFGAIDYGNAAQDISPTDVESITVLKGPNAAALYGSRAANGAIIITTKSGRSTSGPSITLNSNVTLETPLRLPSYQNQYGQGSQGEFAYVDGRGGGVNDGFDESWGPPLDVGLEIPQFFSNGQPAPWVSHPNNVRDFFDLGRTMTNNVAFTTGTPDANVRLSLTDMRQDAMVPGQQTSRTTVSMNGGASLNDRLTTNASVNYIRSEGENRTATGYEGQNIMQQFIWFGRQVDINRLRDYKLEDTPVGHGGTQYNWNHNYFQNPYWVRFENRNWDNRDRVIGNTSLSYQFADWLTGSVRAGTDFYRDSRTRTWAAGDLSRPRGSFEEYNTYRNETNLDALLSATRQVSPDFSVTSNFGGNLRFNRAEFQDIAVAELSVPGVYSLANAGSTPVVENPIERRQINSLYGSAEVAYRDFLFLEATGRNDWSSTLPAGNNSYFYPSVSTSFVFTELLDLPAQILSYGKLRASWAQVGNDADPYQLRATYTSRDPWGGTPAYRYPNILANPDLMPEETESWELGAELSFLDDRLGLDITYYDQITRNQILSAQVSGATGFQERVLNAGAIANRGIEVLVSTVPVALDNGFRWDLSVNVAQNRSTVEELYDGLSSYILGDYWGVTAEARPGEPYGQLYGSPYLRDDDGRLIVNAQGVPQADPNRVELGNYNPDWTAGIRNGFRYGLFDASFLFDVRQGGSIFSMSNMFGNYAGVLEETLRGREVAWNDPGILVHGVHADGSPNDITITSQQYFRGHYGIHEAGIFDASFIKLREATIGIAAPASWFRGLPISGMDVAVTGRNLWLSAKAPHIDPETAFDTGNAQGFEFGQLPTPRSIGINFTITP